MTALTPPLLDWPGDLAELSRRSLVTEYASLTKDGRPITWPVTPYLGDGTLDVSTGLTYPAKAERARRDPRVAVLFSTRIVPGMTDPAVVLVQGVATVRDADPQANTDRYVGEQLAKLPQTFAGVPRFLPEIWTAPEGTTAPPSDPAPTGPALGSGWSKPAGDWRPFADRAERLGAPVLTVAGEDGWPLPVRCTDSRRTQDGFLVTPPAGVRIGAGPACLTAHRHDEEFTGQENVVLVGSAEPAGDGRVLMRVERALTDWSLTGSKLARTVGFLTKGRPLARRLEIEAARRGQPAPRVRL